MKVAPILLHIAMSSHVGVLGIISRCTLKMEDSLSFQCRKRHVIYDPVVSLGQNDAQPCVAGPHDCAGLSSDLRRMRNKCFWRRRCFVQWKTNQPLSSIQGSCNGQTPTYVAYDTPKCILKANVFSICDESGHPSQVNEGVIRSHDLFPRQFPRLNTTCTLRLRAKDGHRLHLSVVHLQLDVEDRLTVRHYRGTKKLELINSNSLTNKQVDVEGGDLDITLEASTEGLTEEVGFIIRFEYIKVSFHLPTTRRFILSNEVITKGQRTPRSKYDASVDERIVRSNSPMTFQCPPSQILYKPVIMAGVSSFGGDRIMSTSRDCHGQYTGLITETNRCYWKQQCQIGGRSSRPLTRTNELRCLALMPDYLSSKGYQCLDKAKVFDMCDKTLVITTTEGLIKSHSNFPWHYTARPIVCRKKIRINPRYGLHLYTEEMDLDPSTRGDNLKILLSRPKKNFFKKYVGGRRVNLHISSGTVIIQFRVSRRSRGGKGFILRFKGIVQSHMDGKKDDDMTNEVPDVEIRQRCKNKDIRTILYEESRKIVATQTRCTNNRRSRRRTLYPRRKHPLSSTSRRLRRQRDSYRRRRP